MSSSQQQPYVNNINNSSGGGGGHNNLDYEEILEAVVQNHREDNRAALFEDGGPMMLLDEDNDDSEEDTEEASETEMGSSSNHRNVDEPVEIKEQMYQDKLATLKKQLEELRSGTHPEYVRRVKKLEHQYNERIRLNEIYREYLISCVERDYILEKNAAVKEYEEKKIDLRENLMTDFEDRRKMIETERSTMELTGDSVDVKPTITRKLRRRPNEPLPVPEKRRKPTSGQLVLLLDEKEVENDLKLISRGKAAQSMRNQHAAAMATVNPSNGATSSGSSSSGSAAAIQQNNHSSSALVNNSPQAPQVNNNYQMSTPPPVPTPVVSSTNSNEVNLSGGPTEPPASQSTAAANNNNSGPVPPQNQAQSVTASPSHPPQQQQQPQGQSNNPTPSAVVVPSTVPATQNAPPPPPPQQTTSQPLVETRIEDGKLLYERRWFHRGQPVYVEGKDIARFSANISAIGSEAIWVKKTSDGQKVRIFTNQLSRGKVSIKRRAN